MSRVLSTSSAFSIGRPHHNILCALARFQYLSAPQITRLVFGTRVESYVRARMKELKDHSYVRVLRLPRFELGGQGLSVYTLASSGVRYLRRAAVTVQQRSSASQAEWTFLKHTLEANDLLIACLQLDRIEGFAVPAYYTERELKRQLMVIPDGWAHVTRRWPGRQRPSHHYLTFELDRGSIDQRPFRKKLRSIVSWLDDPNGYEAHFGTAGANIAFVTTESPRRLETILRWSEEEFQDSDYADLFLFSYFDPATAEPLHLALSPIWYQPFKGGTCQLLEPPN